MSFILDALKKSENERKRTIGPSLADAPVQTSRSDKPWWAVAVAALLVINLGVLVVVLTRKSDSTPIPAVAAAAPAVAAPSPAPVQSSNAPMPRANPNAGSASSPAVRSLAEEASSYDDEYPEPAGTDYPPANPALAAASAVPEGPPMVRPIDAPAVAPLTSRPEYRGAAADVEVLPTLSSLTASGTSLPDMKLDIHVYSGNPSERFVFVNMRKYTEGQTLSEGPVVERIRPDGVVLNAHGTRFLVPRQ